MKGKLLYLAPSGSRKKHDAMGPLAFWRHSISHWAVAAAKSL